MITTLLRDIELNPARPEVEPDPVYTHKLVKEIYGLSLYHEPTLLDVEEIDLYASKKEARNAADDLNIFDNNSAWWYRVLPILPETEDEPF